MAEMAEEFFPCEKQQLALL